MQFSYISGWLYFYSDRTYVCPFRTVFAPTFARTSIFEKNIRFAFGYSQRVQLQNKFVITVLPYLRFYYRYCFFDDSRNINWSWYQGEKFTGWNKMRKFQPATEFRISHCGFRCFESEIFELYDTGVTLESERSRVVFQYARLGSFCVRLRLRLRHVRRNRSNDTVQIPG